eukprot:GHVS01091618.1.p1 GENE.GHVS01091618.1~~GHVS01091618.1.p1  ORF type:complete len:257 (-),score=52.83 GHVS01091618.1:854-1624(-)
MKNKDWSLAYNEYFEAFRNYQEAASNIKGKRALVCAVFCNMMAESQINPFDSQEARSYLNDEDLAQIIALRIAFEAKDMKTLLQVLDEHNNNIHCEPLLEVYLPELIHKSRLRALHSLVKPYRRVGLGYLAEELGTSEAEVQQTIFKLICYGEMAAWIDDINKQLELSTECSDYSGMLVTLAGDVSEWAHSLETLRVCVSGDMMLMHTNTTTTDKGSCHGSVRETGGGVEEDDDVRTIPTGGEGDTEEDRGEGEEL